MRPVAKVAVLDDYAHLTETYADWSRLAGRCEVTVFHQRFPTAADLVANVTGYDVLVTLRERSRIDEDVLRRLPRLRLIVTTGPYNAAIDVAAAADRGIPVCATRLSMTSTIEFVFALMFALTRPISAEDEHIRRGGWQLDRVLGPSLHGKTLALIGFGLIGREVARIALSLGMAVTVWSENLREEDARAAGVEPVTKDELLRRADVLSIHTRLSARTHNLVDAAELALMKPSSYLINTSRGGIVNESALVQALRGGRLAGAALDVFEHEPLPNRNSLLDVPNLILSPHIAAMTRDHISAWFTDVVDDILGWLDGQPIRVLEPHARQ